MVKPYLTDSDLEEAFADKKEEKYKRKSHPVIYTAILIIVLLLIFTPFLLIFI